MKITTLVFLTIKYTSLEFWRLQSNHISLRQTCVQCHMYVVFVISSCVLGQACFIYWKGGKIEDCSEYVWGTRLKRIENHWTKGMLVYTAVLLWECSKPANLWSVRSMLPLWTQPLPPEPLAQRYSTSGRTTLAQQTGTDLSSCCLDSWGVHIL